MSIKWKFFFLALIIYTALVSYVTVKVTKEEPKPSISIATNTSSNSETDQSHKEKSVEKFTEEITQPDGTKIKRTGERELTIEDFLKQKASQSASATVAVKLPEPESDNFSVDVDTKNIEDFPKLDLKSVSVGVRATEHWWAYYRKDFETSDNIVGVRYTTRVCLWRCH